MHQALDFDAEAYTSEMVRLIADMIKRPAAALVSSIEMLGQSVQRAQRIDGIVSRMAHTLSRASTGVRKRANPSTPCAQSADDSGKQPAFRDEAIQPDWRMSERDFSSCAPDSLEKDGADLARGARADRSEPNNHDNPSKDLQDDMLKLVRYRILFVKRGYEHAFQEKEALVSDNLDKASFTAWKIAEFLQELRREEIRLPRQWTGKSYPPNEQIKNGKLIGLTFEDEKHLRVYYEVLDRYPREKLEHEAKHIRILEEMRDALGDTNS